MRARRHANPPPPRVETANRREELNQPVFAAIDAFEYPELHDESIAARSFFLQLARLLAVCGVKDFGMKVRRMDSTWRARLRVSSIHRDRGRACMRDVIMHSANPLHPMCNAHPSPPPTPHPPQDVHKPDSARLRRHLSAIINFAKFREEKLVAYAELQARIEALAERKRAALEERAARVGGVGALLFWGVGGKG